MAELAERIARYRELLLKDSLSRVYVPLADLLQQSGELEEALLLLEDGLSRNPGHQAAMVVLGRTLLQAGREDHGVKVLQRVLELSPDNFIVLRTLAENFMHRDAFTHALPMLERLVEIEPEEKEWPKQLADVRERLVPVNDAVQPSEQTSQAKQTEPTTTSENPAGTPGQGLVTMTLVDIMVAQGYMDKALKALGQMLEANPDRRDVSERLAELKAGLARPAEPRSGSGDSNKMDLPSGAARIKMRDSQKKQFGDWIENLKTEEDPTS